MSSVQFNLALAQAAVFHVNAIMAKGPGPANRPEYVRRHVSLTPRVEGPDPRPAPAGFGARVTPWQQNKLDEQRARARYDADVAVYGESLQNLVNQQRTSLATDMAIVGDSTPLFGTALALRAEAAIRIANHIERTALGNCGEQSYVAFKYLIKRGASGLAIVNWSLSNHMFVVIGMEPKLITPSKTFATLNEPPKWGPNAVVCDPWYNEWFSIHAKLEGAAPANNPAGNLEWHRKMKRILGETVPSTIPKLDKLAADRDGPEAQAAYAAGMKGTLEFATAIYVENSRKTFQDLAAWAQV